MIKDQVITCRFLGYAQNHMGCTYHVLNVCSKIVVPSCDEQWLNKTYGKYVSILEHTKDDTYILNMNMIPINELTFKNIIISKLKTSIPSKMLVPCSIIVGENTYIILQRLLISFKNKIRKIYIIVTRKTISTRTPL